MKRVLLSVVTVAALGSALVTPCQASGKPPRIERKIGEDSTLFTLKLDGKTKPKAGRTFKVRIHITPKNHWHVFSAKMTTEGGLVPMSVRIPFELDTLFEIVNIDEFGTPTMRYDSNFQSITAAYYQPFDVVATIRVKENSALPVPFYLHVHFQTCNENQCMPPRTFVVPMAVLGEKPIDLKIAHGRPVRIKKPTSRGAGEKASERSSMMKDSHDNRVSIVTSENNFREMMSEMNVGRGA